MILMRLLLLADKLFALQIKTKPFMSHKTPSLYSLNLRDIIKTFNVLKDCYSSVNVEIFSLLSLLNFTKGVVNILLSFFSKIIKVQLTIIIFNFYY